MMLLVHRHIALQKTECGRANNLLILKNAVSFCGNEANEQKENKKY